MKEDSQLTIQEPPEPVNILAVIARAAQDPTIDVEKMERLLGLAERMEDRNSERNFAEALVALQGETIRVVATKKVDEKPDGTCRYKFAPYEEIMSKVQPILTAHGFSITFDTKIADDGSRLTSICTLTHRCGHSRSNSFAVRFGKPPGSSDAQGDMSTKSYAKRGALCDALNITIDHDDDARGLGDFITDKEAATLADWVEATNSDRAKFLAFAGATSFEEIRANRLDELHAILKKRELKPKAPKEGLL